MLTVQDGFTRFATAYPICNKKAGTVARVIMRLHFSVFGLPNQIHSDNGPEFLNKLWIELFLKFENPSSNIVKRWHRTIVSILRMMGGGGRFKMNGIWVGKQPVWLLCIVVLVNPHHSLPRSSLCCGGQTIVFHTTPPPSIEAGG